MNGEALDEAIEEGPCDGCHDKEAPALYLCTRCFPYERGTRKDLETLEDREDVYEDEGADEDQGQT